MLKLLIADDNKDFDISIINFIRENKLDYIKFEGICTTGLDAYRMIKKFHPDIVILDIKIPKMNGIEVIKKLINEGMELPKIILVTAYSNLLNGFIYREKIYKFLFKPFDMSLLTSYIEDYYLEIQENSFNNEIVKILNNFDFNTNSLGYKYLIECIKFCIKNPLAISNLEKNVYTKVSNIFHVSNSFSIKWSVEKCIDSMFRYTKTNILQKFFPDTSKPSPKIFIKKIIGIVSKKEI